MTQAPDQPSTETIFTIPPTDVLRRLATLKTASTPQLRQWWKELFGSEPPRFNRRFLQDRLGHRVQELAFGGLQKATVVRLEVLGERLDGGNITLRRLRADDRPIPGTKLQREYRDVTHTVEVLADGFAYEGRFYRSLSAIARTITGTRWNGWVFFGLRKGLGS